MSQGAERRWLAASHTSGPLPEETDVLVVGGGIAGAATAYYLARSGVEVLLVERGELNREASGTNAGSLHLQLAIHQFSGHGTAADEQRLLGDLRASVEAFDFWRGLDEELGESVDLHVTGGWMVAERPEELETLRAKLALEERAGLETHLVTGAQLRDVAPFFSDSVLGATYCPAEGNANPLVVAPLFARRAVELGAEVRTGAAVLGIERGPGRTGDRFVVRTSRGTVRAHRVVDCAGAWSGHVAAMVGLRFPVRHEGLHVNVTDPRPPLLPAMVQHIGRRLTLKQASNGSFIIGGGWPAPWTGEGVRPPTVWSSAAGNTAVALDVVPELARANVVRTWSGVIVFTDDFAPVVGESHAVPGFFACVASTGFTFGPLYARRLADLMVGGGLPFPDSYSLDRVRDA